MCDTEGLRVEGLVANSFALLGIKFRQQAVGISARLSLCLADDNMRAETIFKRAIEFGGAGGHIVDQILGALNRFGPHQVNVTAFCRRVLGRWR